MAKGKLKARILKNIGWALLFTSVVSTIVAYLYFNNVIRKKVIDDEAIKLRQMSYQLEYMMKDIDNFSRIIAVDPAIQALVVREDFDSEFEKVKVTFDIASELQFYKTLHNYVGGIVLRSTRGVSYGSVPNADLRYYDEKFSIPALAYYVEHEDQIISNPFYAYEVDVAQDVITYGTTIRKLTQADQIIGELYVDIYLEHFLREIRVYASNYDNVILMDDIGNIVYAKKSFSSFLENEVNRDELTKSGVIKTKDGYLIVEPIEAMGWTIGTFVNDAYIWERSRFVLHFFIVFFLVSLALLLSFTSGILDSMIKPITRLTKAMDTIDYETMEVDLDIHTGDEIELLTDRFKEMLNQINVYMAQLIEDEKKQKEMSFDILLSQINPHYLYNVLNTVVYLSAEGKNKEVAEVVNALTYTLQETLKVGEKHVFTTLEQEIRFLENYVKIQTYRYPKRFEVRVECDPSLYQAIVPKTILQPLVENALLHGIIPEDIYGEIIISVLTEDDLLYIKVKDNGIGVDPLAMEEILNKDRIGSKKEASGRQHIGIRNIHDRIRHLFGEDYGLSIESEETGGTIVKICFPNE